MMYVVLVIASVLNANGQSWRILFSPTCFKSALAQAGNLKPWR